MAAAMAALSSMCGVQASSVCQHGTILRSHCLCPAYQPCSGSHCVNAHEHLHARHDKALTGFRWGHCTDCRCGNGTAADDVSASNANAAAVGWGIVWLHEQLWEKHYVRDQMFVGHAIRGEAVYNMDSGDGWRETMADFTILVIYQGFGGPEHAARYIEAFRTKGFKSVVVVHFGDEVDFDNDGSGKCSGRLYNELRVPIVRNYWAKSCAENPHVHIVPLGQGACKPECRANLPSYHPWHYFGNISRDTVSSGDRRFIWSFASQSARRSAPCRHNLVEKFAGLSLSPRKVDFERWHDDGGQILPPGHVLPPVSAKLEPVHDVYQRTLCDTVFSLCPSGNAHDTWRLMESLECGAIPVVTDGAEYFAKWIPFAHTFITTDLYSRGDDPAVAARALLADPAALEDRRLEIAKLYSGWKRKWQGNLLFLLDIMERSNPQSPAPPPPPPPLPSPQPDAEQATPARVTQTAATPRKVYDVHAEFLEDPGTPFTQNEIAKLLEHSGEAGCLKAGATTSGLRVQIQGSDLKWSNGPGPNNWMMATRVPAVMHVLQAAVTAYPVCVEHPCNVHYGLDDTPTDGTFSFCRPRAAQTASLYPSPIWGDVDPYKFGEQFGVASEAGHVSPFKIMAKIQAAADARPWESRVSKLSGAGKYFEARDDFLEWSVANTDIASIHVIYGGSHGPIRNAKLKRDLLQVGFASEENRPWDELMGFQFCVGMQGNQGATRWDLMYVIATGCVLLMHQPADHVFDEWWYPLLQENRHYLRFESSSELRNLWARLEGDRPFANKLRENLSRVSHRLAAHGQALLDRYVSEAVRACG